MVGPRQYNSVKYIVMLRGRSILFQATRMRNSLIRPAVRYSIHDKRDPTYHMYTFYMYGHVPVSHITYRTSIFNLHYFTQKVYLRRIK